MKPRIKGSIFLVFVLLSLQSNAQKPVAKQPATNILPPVKLKNSQDSLQYALGAFVADYLGKAGFTTINVVPFLAGMDDMLRNHPRMIADSNIYPYISNYQNYNLKQQGKALENEMFNVLKDRSDLGKLPSGVQYRVLKPGKGERPQETDSVIVHFKGTLPNGTVFENTYLKNAPTITTPATMIPGLSEAIQLMPVNATWQIFIPSKLAYGEKGNGNIPPNSALMITIELLAIKKV